MLGDLRRHLKVIFNLLGVILGIVVGFGVRSTDPSPTLTFWIGMCDDLFKPEHIVRLDKTRRPTGRFII